ncbi:hypothetical protein K504DRAFT_487880 [Pleomassaria siparia CBS 279.74]|uniref:Uncharacterized protein n=1 Tax=Pleomassaria siparia CBS 279.74 TaxID=1314801 RepID=A0A6G1KLX4_9PLEO|nr:hypothetical protein K504DRAFT_487880 [Pleomassaria siparia CBS 279.74]
MVRLDAALAFSALGLGGVLAHPTIKHLDTIKHIDRRVCNLEERNPLVHKPLTSRATIPKATTWDPPASMVTGLDQQTMKENPDGLKDLNWITDQLMVNKGNINYCIRWANERKSTEAARAATVKALQRSWQKWFDVLVGYDGFPLTEVKINVNGYGVKDKSLLEGSTAGLNIYTDVDSDGVPNCDTRCYRGAHLDGDLSGCPGGEQNRYDIYLQLDKKLEGQFGGFGYNWGEELGPDYFLDNLETENIHILLHEIGHGFGLLDFYDWVPEGQTSFVMMAGSATEITEFDAWMLRDWWRKLKAVRGW